MIETDKISNYSEIKIVDNWQHEYILPSVEINIEYCGWKTTNEDMSEGLPKYRWEN